METTAFLKGEGTEMDFYGCAVPGSRQTGEKHSEHRWTAMCTCASSRAMRLPWLRYLGKAALVFGAYFVTARLGLRLGAVAGFATLVWPPTGISLAALFLFGDALWPAVALGPSR